MFKKLFKWENQVSIYRPRSSGHLASSKRSSGGFFIKNSGKYAISHDYAKGTIHQHHFRFPEAFRMTVWNQFSLFPWCAATKVHSVSIRTIVRIFRMFMQNLKTWFFNSFLQFLSFLHFDSTSTTSKSTPNPCPNQLHYFFHYAFGSSSTLFIFFNLIHLFCHQFIKNIP